MTVHFRVDRIKDSDPIKISFRGAVLKEREKNELNNQGICILESQFINEGKSYDELRKISKFEVNHQV